MSFQPTKQQLEELGFTERSPFWFYWDEFIHLETRVMYNKRKNKWFFDYDVDLYPESIDDIKTLIRLLSPNN